MRGDTTNILTAARVAGIRARLAAATSGPWWYNPAKCYRPGENGAKPVRGDQEAVFYATGTVALTGVSGDPQSMADAALIAAAPTDIADLLAEVDRLTARVAELERARDVAGIVGWLRAKVGAAYGSGHVPGTAGWTYREIADAIERGDWREEPAVPAPPPDALPEQVPEVPRG